LVPLRTASMCIICELNGSSSRIGSLAAEIFSGLSTTAVSVVFSACWSFAVFFFLRALFLAVFLLSTFFLFRDEVRGGVQISSVSIE
jgi:hypothetical protein